MGSNSNRPDTKEEKIAKFTGRIAEAKRLHTDYSDFQTTVGAEIRGEMGIEKGNEFIKAINKALEK